VISTRRTVAQSSSCTSGERPRASPMTERDLAPTTLVVVRTIAAPVAEVFEAWTDPTLLSRWLAPGPLVVTPASGDARVGGEYRIVARDPLGTDHVTTGEYREVLPPTRLVQTWV